MIFDSRGAAKCARGFEKYQRSHLNCVFVAGFFMPLSFCLIKPITHIRLSKKKKELKFNGQVGCKVQSSEFRF
jgi:hypothetical protein